MTLKRIVIGLAVLTLMTAASSTAAADEPHGYYGVVQGIYSSFDASGPLSDVVDLTDDDDFGFGVLAGYQVNRYLGIEAGWIDLGKAKGRGTDSQDVPVTVNPGASGPVGQVVGSYPLADWLSLNGNIGAFFWDSKTRTSASSETVFQNDDGVGLSLGAGAQAQVHPNIAIRLGYTRFFDVGDLDIDTVLLSVVFQSWDNQ